MKMYDLIVKKKQGFSLTQSEIREMIRDYVNDRIPDYQMSAMLMAICFQGMSKEETHDLTLAMKESGDVLDLSSIRGIKVDKHSTGGVGDKTTLCLAPLVASLGVNVAKMSGRGLGHTGGTIDKLEGIPGFRTNLTMQEFVCQVNDTGIAVMGQSHDIAPADKKLYALRDVTGTVDQVSLIASSIMSKKLAAGADKIVLDVKCGNGAFMKTLPEASALAHEMVSIGKYAGKEVVAYITDMNQPLGNAVGNILEVKEAIATLKGEGPLDFQELCYTLATEMVLLAKVADTKEQALSMLRDSIASGKAFDKFCEFVKVQGGDLQYIYDPRKLPVAAIQMDVFAPKTGYISSMNCEEIGLCSLELGGGRLNKESVIDLTVGMVLHHKIGDYVLKGTPLATIHAKAVNVAEQVANRLQKAYEFSDCQVKVSPIIIERISI